MHRSLGRHAPSENDPACACPVLVLVPCSVPSQACWRRLQCHATDFLSWFALVCPGLSSWPRAFCLLARYYDGAYSPQINVNLRADYWTVPWDGAFVFAAERRIIRKNCLMICWRLWVSRALASYGRTHLRICRWPSHLLFLTPLSSLLPCSYPAGCYLLSLLPTKKGRKTKPKTRAEGSAATTLFSRQLRALHSYRRGYMQVRYANEHTKNACLHMPSRVSHPRSAHARPPFCAHPLPWVACAATALPLR